MKKHLQTLLFLLACLSVCKPATAQQHTVFDDCVGDCVNLIAPKAHAKAYLWFNGATTQSTNYCFKDSGLTALWYRYTTDSGTYSDTTYVYAHPKPVVTIYTIPNICKDSSSIDLTPYASIPAGGSGTWRALKYPFSVVNNILSTNGLSADTCTLVYTAKSMYGCTTTSKVVVNIVDCRASVGDIQTVNVGIKGYLTDNTLDLFYTGGVFSDGGIVNIYNISGQFCGCYLISLENMQQHIYLHNSLPKGMYIVKVHLKNTEALLRLAHFN